MIRKFIKRFFTRAVTPSSQDVLPPTLCRISRKQHGITRNQISASALKVTLALQQAGYSAYIVGGAIRDLLLDIKPKDFDIATNAMPEEVRGLFRRSRIIGRRFRLVHVMFGDEIVEVSTFRANYSADNDAGMMAPNPADPHGRLLHDNIFGSQEEDVLRRDFTMNALLYNPATEEILDYLNGYQDIQARCLRIIGNPEQRYREDPVRMLRAVRLAAKLNVQLDEITAAPIGDLAPLLQNVPSARLFDEILKLLLSGHSLACLIDLRKRGLHHGLLPILDIVLEQPLGERFISIALKNTDERIQQNKPVSAGFMFAILLWHETLAAWNRRLALDEKPIPALHQAMTETLSTQRAQIAMPRRFDSMIYDIWTLQPRFQSRSGTRPFRLLEHPRFRAAYDFLWLRCESGEIDKEIAEWWHAFQHASPANRESMLIKETPVKKRKRNTRKRKSIAHNNEQLKDSPVIGEN